MNIDRELGENEYINPEDGLIYRSICRRPKERIMYFLDEYRHVPVICKCREEEKEQERLEEERRERMLRIERLRFLGMQDKKLREYTFDNDKGFCPDLYKARNYVDNFAELSQSGRGLILCGPSGERVKMRRKSGVPKTLGIPLPAFNRFQLKIAKMICFSIKLRIL